MPKLTNAEILALVKDPNQESDENGHFGVRTLRAMTKLFLSDDTSAKDKIEIAGRLNYMPLRLGAPPLMAIVEDPSAPIELRLDAAVRVQCLETTNRKGAWAQVPPDVVKALRNIIDSASPDDRVTLVDWMCTQLGVYDLSRKAAP